MENTEKSSTDWFAGNQNHYKALHMTTTLLGRNMKHVKNLAKDVKGYFNDSNLLKSSAKPPINPAI